MERLLRILRHHIKKNGGIKEILSICCNSTLNQMNRSEQIYYDEYKKKDDSNKNRSGHKYGKANNDYPDKFKITYSCGIDNSTKRTIIVDSLMCTGSYLRYNFPELQCYSAKSIDAVLCEEYKKGDFKRCSYIDQPGGFISPSGRVQFTLGNELLPKSHIELILPDEVNGVRLAGKNFEELEKVFPLALQTVGPPVYLAAAYLAIVTVRSLLFKEGIDFQGILYIYGAQGNGKTTLAKSILGVYRREGDCRPFGMVQAGSTFAAVEKYMVLLKDMPLIVDDLCLSASKDTERKRKDLDANLIRLGSGDVPIIKKMGNQFCESKSNAGLVLTAEFTLENASYLSRCILVPVNKHLKLPEEICPELFGAALRKYVVWFSENYEEEIERLKRELPDSRCSPEERVSTNYWCLHWAFSGMLMSLGISTDARKKLMLQMAKAMDKSLDEYTQLKTKLDKLIKKGNIAYILLKGYKSGAFDLAQNIENLKKHGGVIWKNDLCLREQELVRFVRNQDGYKDSKKSDIVRVLNDYGALVIQEEGGYTVHLSKDPSACRVYRIRLDALKEHKENTKEEYKMEIINSSCSSQPATRTELPLALTVEDVMTVLNIGRNAAYNLLRSNQIWSLRIGKQIRVPRQAMLEFLGETA